MTAVEDKIMEALMKALPKLSEREKCELLAFAEGMAFKASQTANTMQGQ